MRDNAPTGLCAGAGIETILDVGHVRVGSTCPVFCPRCRAYRKGEGVQMGLTEDTFTVRILPHEGRPKMRPSPGRKIRLRQMAEAISRSRRRR